MVTLKPLQFAFEFYLFFKLWPCLLTAVGPRLNYGLYESEDNDNTVYLSTCTF